MKERVSCQGMEIRTGWETTHVYKKKVEEEEQDRDNVYSYMLYMYKNNKKKPSQIQMTKSIQVRRVHVK